MKFTYVTNGNTVKLHGGIYSGVNFVKFFFKISLTPNSSMNSLKAVCCRFLSWLSNLPQGKQISPEWKPI